MEPTYYPPQPQPYPQPACYPPQPAAPSFRAKRIHTPRRQGRAALNKTSAIVLAQSALGLALQVPIMALCLSMGVDILGDKLLLTLFTAALSPLATGLPALIYLLASKADWNQVLHFQKVGFFSAIPWVLAGLGLSLAGNYPAFFLETLLEYLGAAPPPDVLGQGDSWLGFGLEFLGVAVLVPMVEEFAFRGVIFSTLEKHGTGFAIAGSSLIFGLAHMSPSSVIFATIAGLGMALVYAKTRNLWVTVAIHALNNGIATFESYLGLLNLGEVKESLLIALLSIVPMVLGTAAFIFLLVRGHRRKLTRQGQLALPAQLSPAPQPDFQPPAQLPLQPQAPARLKAGSGILCLLSSPVLWGLVLVMALETLTMFL